MAKSSKPKQSEELQNAGYEIFVGVLSVLSIVNLVLLYWVTDDPALRYILYAMNGLLSAIFFGDFLWRFKKAPSRSAYFFRQFGWADLLASLPIPQVKVLRLFRVLRVYRILRAYGFRMVVNVLVRDRAGSALLILLLMGIFVLEFGSLAMVNIEADAQGANITTASDGLWYTIVTISTVGYGDLYPVTNQGRLMGALIIVIGVGIFGTFTGYLANLFLSAPDPEDELVASDEQGEAVLLADADADAERADLLREQVDQLRTLLEQQQRSVEAFDQLLQTKGA